MHTFHAVYIYLYESFNLLKIRCSSFFPVAKSISPQFYYKRMEKVHDGAQRKMVLKQEVARLSKMLEYEERVHEILENAARGNVRPIPAFLPPKMKKLLAELAMVDEEIVRLEHEIIYLQSLDQKPFHASKSQSLPTNPSLYSPFLQSRAPSGPSTDAKWTHERGSSEARALFFINQAIKGNYSSTANGAFPMGNERTRKSSGTFDNIKGGQIKEIGLLQDYKMSKKSGIIEKPTSHKLPPKHPSAKLAEHDVEIPSSLPRKSLSESGPLEDTIDQKLQPNKLSENIMKCLICIFVRLIRTSRTMELEKQGNLARSTNLSPISRSFRSEVLLNLKGNPPMPREMGQQDPYEILTFEDSLPRDIGPYKNLVKFTSGSLDVKNVSSSVPLLRKLRGLLSILKDVDLSFLSYPQKLAFWTNMYNACVMHGFLQYGLPSSSDKLLDLLNKATLNVGGNKLNALAIGHLILRQPNIIGEAQWNYEKDDKENAIRRIYGLDPPEPNVIFALSCGSKSSPAVRIYVADTILTELEKSKLDYLQASIVVTATKKVFLPSLLLWNKNSFANDVDSLLQWICNQLPTSGSLRKSMMDCLRKQSSAKILDIVDSTPYDFEFQYLLAV